jgi:asparagine synthase (glutamine-hydrolysing)
MSTMDGRYWITFNGELYNYAELRAELLDQGAAFTTRTDTEVILNAYAAWGAGCVDRFRGMFAFGILDVAEGTVFLARDRFGIKPLYYTESASGLAFASELRAFLAGGLVARQADRQAIWDYLSLGSVAAPNTIVAGVRSVPAGHWLVVDRSGKVTSTFCYWDIVSASARGPEAECALSFPDAAERLRWHLEEATRYHVVADVPVGAFLSGGMDSAAMVGLMARHVSYPLQTFTVGFESRHRDFSETDQARETASYFGADHRDVIVTDAEAGATFPAIVDALDQPSMDGANTYFVSRCAGESVKVALSGLGGDELFAGYPHFRRHLRAVGLREKLGVLAPALGCLRALPNRFRHNLTLPALDAVERAETLRCKAYEDDKRRLVNPEFLAGWTPQPLGRLYAEGCRRVTDPVRQLSYLELTGYMGRTLLRDVDAMGMAHGLEVRPILLDHVLAEFAFGLPSCYKLRGTAAKAVFQAALSDVIPEFVMMRPKRGFELPLLRWLSGPLLGEARAVFSGRWARSLFRGPYLRRALRRIESPAPRDFPLWCTFVLLRWLEAWRVEP